MNQPAPDRSFECVQPTCGRGRGHAQRSARDKQAAAAVDREENAQIVPREIFHIWASDYRECPYSETHDTSRLPLMNIILIGAGRIGSVLAFHLARAGNDVTVVARGARREALMRDGAIVTTDGARARISVATEFDPSVPCELLIATVPEHQIGPLLPDMTASRAERVLLMFNTFQGIAPYQARIGRERFAFGFPNMTAHLVEQQLRFRVDGPGMTTTMSRPELAALFRAAGMPSRHEPDIEAFLRSHVALAVPLFLAALWTHGRDSELTWKEARRLDAAWAEGFALVKSLGHRLIPHEVAILSSLPAPIRTGFLWAFSRNRLVKDVAHFGPCETRYLVDAMVAVSPEHTRLLATLRP